MSSFKLSKLILERDATKKPSSCGSNAAVETNQANFGTYQMQSTKYITWTEEVGFTVYYYYCTKPSGSNPPVVPPVVVPPAGEKCPEDEGYVTKEFQEWVWKVKNGFLETDKKKTKLCGGAKCDYKTAVDGDCGPSTKALWKDETLKQEFISYKKQNPVITPDPIVQPNTEEQKIAACKTKNLEYDKATDQCVVPKQELDPDAQLLKDQMQIYRNILNRFTDSKGWTNVDSLSPGKYIPANLDINMLEQITNQIVSLIKRKSRSKDYGLFKKLMSSLSTAYNVEKYKDFFSKQIDPESTGDVFEKIKGFIAKIDTQAQETQDAYNFDPLTNPEEVDVRNFIYTGQFLSVYKVGSLNLMMMVYFYNSDQRVKGSKVGFDKLWQPKEDYWNEKPEVLKKVYDIYKTVHGSYTFDNCKKILGAYKDTINSIEDRKLYSESPRLKEHVKYEIQKCWCADQYKELGKLGVKNMFDVEMKKDRKELIKFLNSLGGATWGDFGIDFSTACGEFEDYK